MANPDPSRTEWPTSKRLDEARKGGNVLSCPDISSIVLISGGVVLLFLTIPATMDAFRDIFLKILQIYCRGVWSDQEICDGVYSGAVLVAKLLAPVCFGICLLASIVMRIQVGTFMSFEPLSLKFDQLWNPKAAFSEIVPNKQSLFNMLISTAKVALVGYMVYTSISREMPALEKLNMMPVWNGVMWVVWAAVFLVLKVMIFFILIVAVSYWFRRKKYYENLMMTKQEVKDEHKNMDGDPLVKSKIRSKMREIFMRSMKGNLKQANVVVTNPTHVAVALKYDPSKDAAPMVVAKGLRIRAQRIKDMARLYQIPIVEAPPLARSLYRNVKVGGFIPPEFYRAVAAILAKLHKSGAKSLAAVLNRKTA